MSLAKNEPTLIAYGLLAALNAVQVAAIPMSTTLHVIVLAVSAGITAVVNRSLVTPAGVKPLIVKPVAKPVAVAKKK